MEGRQCSKNCLVLDEHAALSANFLMAEYWEVNFLLGLDYWEPNDLWETVAMLSQAGESVKLLAGGTDLLVRMKRKQVNCTGIINLKKLPGLDQIVFDGQTLRIGALTKISGVVENETIKEYFPILATAARSLGTPQIRNLATVGGNLCNASPAADVVPALLVYGACLQISGVQGTREITLDKFLLGPGQTALAKGEIVTAIELVPPVTDARGVFIKHGKRKSHEIAIVNLAVLLEPNQDNTSVAAAKIALGAVASTAIRVRQAEEALTNQKADENLWELAAAEAMAAVDPIDDVRSTAGYRKQMAGVLTKRALRMAWGGEA